MAYSDEVVKSKLNTLSETQDSIVTVAQWIMFHKRNADHTAALWLSRLQDSPTPAKRLTLIYLANEVVQQSRARGKNEFLVAFEPVISEATAVAYKTASSDIREKLRRVVEVWRQRHVFDRSIQETTEQRLRELDQQRAGKSGGARLGGSLFGGGSGHVPAELSDVAKSQTALNRSDANTKPDLEKAQAEYAKMMDPGAVIQSPPVHAHKLRELSKVLATARVAVEQSIKVRQELIAGLEKLVESSKARLTGDEAARDQVLERLTEVESKTAAVEDAIVRGVENEKKLNGDNSGTMGDGGAPEIEGFTPPAPEVESFTPPATELANDQDNLRHDLGDAGVTFTSTSGADVIREQPPSLNEPPPTVELPPAIPTADPATAANSFLADLSASGLIKLGSGETADDAAEDTANDPRLKRRKITHHKENDVDADIFGTGDAGVDEDGISALLGDGGDITEEADVSKYGW